MVDSTDLAQVLQEASDIARSVEHKLTSAHVLLAMFTVESRAQLLLREKGVNEDSLLEQLTAHDTEQDGLVRTLFMRAREIAQSIGSREADCLHLLVAFTRVACTARELLTKACPPLVNLANTALSYCVSGGLPRRLQPGRTPTPLSIPRPTRPPGSPPLAPPAASVASSVVQSPPLARRPYRPAFSLRDLIDEVNDPGPTEFVEPPQLQSQNVLQSYSRAQTSTVVSTSPNQDTSSPAVLATRSERARPKVFIGHGHSDSWRALSAFLKDDLGLDPQEFNSVPIAGKHTIERLKDLLKNNCVYLN